MPEIKKVKSVRKVTTTLYGPASHEPDSLLGLMRKLAERRDYWANVNGKECVLNWSYCVGPDTDILTNVGYLKAKEVSKLSDKSVKLWSGKEWVSKKTWISSGIQESYKITFTDGYSIVCSWNHPFRIKGNPVQAFELKEGDTLDTNITPVPQENSKLYYLFGLFRDLCYDSPYSDGTHKVYFTEEFKDGTDYITNTLKDLNISWIKQDIYGVKRVFIAREDTRNLYKYFFTSHRHDRELCDEIMNNTKFYASYLRGAFDADGSYVNKGMLRLTQTSEKLAVQSVRMLEALGFTCTIQKDEIGREHPKYDIYIKGGVKSFIRFQKVIGFSIPRKAKAVQDYIDNARKINNFEYGRKIRFIERTVSEVFGPVKVEGDWYVANGVVNHNTPFTSKNHTPFEYASCIAGLSNKKTLTPAVEAARKYGFKFRVGTSSDTSAIAQVLTLGDRRLAPLIYEGYKSGVIQYFGGMSAGKDAFEGFEKLLKKIGHSYETYSKEKPLHMVFPWSFIDAGLSEEYRKERYLLSRAAMNSDFGCFNSCTGCSACQTSQDNLPQKATVKAITSFEQL